MADTFCCNVDGAWYFVVPYGSQHYTFKDTDMQGIAVRAGDVTVSPEPISSALLIIGAGVLAEGRYLKRKK